MRNYLAVLTLFFCFSLCGSDSLSIVFVHVGPQLPPYASTSLDQARTFNPDCPIYLLASKQALNNFSQKGIKTVAYNTIPFSKEHNLFCKQARQTDPFWRYTSERFLYLYDFMLHYNLENVFHLENDVMLYADLRELLPLFQSHYPCIASTFDNEERCIPGFVYIPSIIKMKKLAKCFADYAPAQMNDMQIFGIFRKKYGERAIDILPIITPEYIADHPLRSPFGHVPVNKWTFCQNSDVFNSIFDAAALGQYLGGIDPILGTSVPGFINERCLFNPSYLTYEWIEDENNRKIPYAIYGGRQWRINNLHIHSKNLIPFKS